MTSESEAFKTNEFLRRRKLRIQQVREQSKEIAKRIRQRAKVEQCKEVVELDAKKQKEYFYHQDKLVKELEKLYAAGVRNIGASHKQASQVNVQDAPEKLDISKKRAKEAAAELRRKKQEKLDEQKKQLDRKLQAREAANEISRDKSSNVASKLVKASSKTRAEAKDNENTQKKSENQIENIVSGEETSNKEVTGNKAELVDMATQWNFEELPEEWEPHIPELLIPKDDKQTPNETVEKNNEIAPDPSKPQNLFALSDEMPLSLRGGLTDNTVRKSVPKTTLNLVSEYLQNRDLHLREYENTSEKSSKKKHDGDLQSLRNTILRARASNNEGIFQQNVCHVADVQVVPVPSWHAEKRYGNCPQHAEFHKHTVPSRQFKTITNYEINQIFSSIRPKQHDMPSPSPVLRGVTPFKRSKFDQKAIAGKSCSQKSTKSNETDIPLVKKKSVTMYDHATRDIKDIPCGDERLVIRDAQAEDDAYSQAARESASVVNDDRHQKKLQDMRNKIAVTKQNVEKEYKDTMAFLKSMPKDKSKPIKYAYMDEDRQESHKELRQRKMQGEFKKIEKECMKQSLNKMNHNPTPNKRRTKSKSPDKFDSEDDFDAKDFQYSWMPVPETDQNLAIHTIPTNVKERKSSNGVHFSKVDSYHEYRSRHKHTPPTKDTNVPKKQMEALKTLVIEEDAENSNSSTFDSEIVSSDTMTPREAPASNGDDAGKLSDAERIIIYKILDTKVSKRDKEKRNKVMTKIAKTLNSTQKSFTEDHPRPSSSKGENKKSRCKHKASKSPVFEQINEGIYKTVNEKRDNITSMYYSERSAEGAEAEAAAARGDDDAKQDAAARAPKVHWESGDEPAADPRKNIDCSCREAFSSAASYKKSEAMPSATTSTSSFRTATNAITQVKPEDGQIDGGYIKLLDEDGQEAGKFYIGATGFIKNDAYEVIIQLKKKDDKTEPVNAHKTTLSEDNTKDSAHMKNKEDSNSKEGTDKNIISEEKSKQKVDQKITPRGEDVDKKQLIDTAIATENDEEIRIVSNDKQAGSLATDSKNKESGTQEEPSSKGDTVPKHTTTCTQTSFENHEERHRPMRMSSTSTAYMSPPEFILPNFLKQDHKISLTKLEDFTVNSNLEGIEFINQESLCCGDYEYCTCKRCIYEKAIIHCGKSYNKEHKLNAPPNTVRSEMEHEDIKLSYDGKIKRHHNHKSKHTHSCRKRSATKAPMIYFAKYNKSITSTKKSHQNLVPTLNAKSIKNKKKNAGSEMNPLIKSYVNRLLNLNKKALKAIEVANQDCSSITTPGSSVVEVSLNKDRKKAVEPKISLEQIKDILIQDIINANDIQRNKFDMSRKDSRRKCFSSYGLKKGSMRKVKSLYVPRKIAKAKSNDEGTSDRDMKFNKQSKSSSKVHERKSATKLPAKTPNLSTSSSKSDEYIIPRTKNSKKTISNQNANWEIPSEGPASVRNPQSSDNNSARSFEPESKGIASGSDSNGIFINLNLPPSTSTQTNLAENNLMRLAEDKLQNMEKIAELTEKCTKRLSSLAKVLEQVRKNKTIAYSQISDSASDSDKMSDQIEAQQKKAVSACDHLVSKTRSNDARMADSLLENVQPEPSEAIIKDHTALRETDNLTDISNNMLSDIPKPLHKIHSPTDIVDITSPSFFTSKNMNDDLSSLKVRAKPPPALSRINLKQGNMLSDIPKPLHKIHSPTDIVDITSPSFFTSKNMNEDLSSLNVRAKPPPALSRINLKQGNDLELVVPHELSTVAEVDSPLSTKLKSQSARNDSQEILCNESRQYVAASKEQQLNPDLLQSSAKLATGHTKMSNDSSDESKIQMLDLKQFNEIMLKPFISINDYVKQCNAPISVNDASNMEQHQKESPVSDDISSLHSDGSLPDVIAELLKRNVIKEPFKFDTASNVNSTTVSSESTFSVLALSKAKKSHALKIQNKENIAETSDSLSISSNPDLELAFKQLGMGWASSTLKKTKERLALSSSSNTSSSSTGMQLKLKANNIDVPYVVSDSVSSLLDVSKKKKVKDPSKNAEQQTSQMDSMTVKDFLTNQLAKKITFTNKSRRDGTEEFISLCETRIPEEVIHEVSGASGGNRARTSTPVQIFKSMAYHSSSSSNISNGLFSNADELSSVKGTSNSIQNHTTSDKDDLTIPNYNLKLRKGFSDTSKSD